MSETPSLTFLLKKESYLPSRKALSSIVSHSFIEPVHIAILSSSNRLKMNALGGLVYMTFKSTRPSGYSYQYYIQYEPILLVHTKNL